MRKFNLQLFAEPVQGKRIVYLFRIRENKASADGTIIALVTENSRSASVDADSTATKDGTIRTPGTPEVEISSTSILAAEDTMIPALEEAMLNNKLVECWEANLDEPADDSSTKFAGRYYQGYITSFEKTSNAEDMVEISIDYGANGSGVAGDVTVSAEQQAAAAYQFEDAVKTGA
ncbi:MAG: phage major tail protein, TP901-1 family [Lachnospiraceae bacterium]|nr:phage major tail protein, TP901-1 family [Lachnospiraceae bacterium]